MEVTAHTLRTALERARWIVTDAARELQVSRSQVYKLMRRYGVERCKDLAALQDRFLEAGKRGGRPRTEAA